MIASSFVVTNSVGRDYLGVTNLPLHRVIRTARGRGVSIVSLPVVIFALLISIRLRKYSQPEDSNDV